jgi:peptide/nickel transport system permease protein
MSSSGWTQRLAERLIRRACRHLAAETRDERYREWTAELPAILHDPGIRPAPRRAVRALLYAADHTRTARKLPAATQPRPKPGPAGLLGTVVRCLLAVVTFAAAPLAAPAWWIRRLLQTVVVTLLVTMITFLLLHLVPGGPVRALLGPKATPGEIAHFNVLYGYNRPLYVQYGKWVWQLLHGNLGYSIKLNQTVASELTSRLPNTLVLCVLGTVVSLLFGIPLGIYQAVKRYTVGDYVLTGVSFLGYATPTFFIALLLVDWFTVDIKLFPPAPTGNTFGQLLSQPRALVLPVLAYAFLLYALWSRYMRSSVMDNLVQDYVRTARAKGASQRRVLWGHVFRNSLISIVTLLGLSLPTLVAGAIFIEYVFNWPGMGLAFYQAAVNVDYASLLGLTLVATAATIIGNLLADVGYAVLDPRVRYS